MTISSETRKAGPYPGNGVAASFPFAFKVFQAADLLVVKAQSSTSAESTLSLGTDYSVTLNPNQDSAPGGSVTLTAGALAAGYTVTIGSAIKNLQPLELTDQGNFYPSVLAKALDRLTILVQQLGEQVSRSLKISFSSTAEASPDALLSALGTATAAATGAATTATGAATTAVNAANTATTVVAGAVQRDGSVAMTAPLTLSGNVSSALQAVPKQQAESIAAAAVANRMQYSLTASLPSSSGLSVDVTSIPSWAARITVMLNGVSTNGTFNPLFQLGSGPFSTSGYAGSQSLITTGVGTSSLTNGFSIGGASAASARCGIFVFEHQGNNAWVCSGTIGFSDSAGAAICAGVITLAGVLDRLRLYAGGTDTFDGGAIRVLIEG